MYIRRAINVFILSSAIVTSTLSAAATIGGRVIEVIADKDNTFKVVGAKKPVISVKAGEQIVLRITSHFGGEQARDGSEHSFVVKKLRDQGWDIRLKEGTRDFVLVAPQQTGEYLIECTVKCGRGHDDMNMKLVVRD
jgi:heme/copper-type cytochrome/quinol oxidase subunit 2